jgi:hypothetical protein
VYSERVVGDLSLTADGTRLPLRLVSSSFASIDELRRGVGENHLELEARLRAVAAYCTMIVPLMAAPCTAHWNP